MPVPEIKATVIGVVSENKPVGPVRGDVNIIDLDDPSPTSALNGQNGAQNELNAILGGLGSTTSTSPSGPPAPQKSAIDDILSLFNTPSSATQPPSVSPQPGAASNSSLFDATSSVAAAPPTAPKLTSYTAYDKNSLMITLTPQTSPSKPGLVNILARFQVTGGVTANGVNFQAAVPKTQQLQMMPMSSPNINPGATETQQMRVMVPVGALVRLRLRISFSMAGRTIQDQVDFSGFPSSLTSG